MDAASETELARVEETSTAGVLLATGVDSEAGVDSGEGEGVEEGTAATEDGTTPPQEIS